MIRRILAMFGRKPNASQVNNPSQGPRSRDPDVLAERIAKLSGNQAERNAAALDVILAMLDNEAETADMLAQARERQGPYVLLAPAVPLPASQSAGWFGGAPSLPDDIAWPEIGGEALRFACQIDLSALPVNIWGGVGPRKGWLAVFLHPENEKGRVLHVDGKMVPRKGPGQSDAQWFWPRRYNRDHVPVQDHCPQ